MPDPTESVIWSPCFLGNGEGVIKTGAFAGWYGASHGPIERNFGKDGKLIDRSEISRNIVELLLCSKFKVLDNSFLLF